MKITIAQPEIVALIAKSLNVPEGKVKVNVKTMDLDIETEIGSLSFGSAQAAVVASPLAEEVAAEETTEAESAPAPKSKAKPKAKKKPVVEEEEIEEEVEEDDDDIDFL